MSKVRLTVVHPADRADNHLTSWRAEVKPSSGTDEMWSPLGGTRPPSQTTLDVGSVPPGSNDYRVFWTDAFDQDTVSDVVTHVVGKPAPLAKGTLSVETVEE